MTRFQTKQAFIHYLRFSVFAYLMVLMIFTIIFHIANPTNTLLLLGVAAVMTVLVYFLRKPKPIETILILAVSFTLCSVLFGYYLEYASPVYEDPSWMSYFFNSWIFPTFVLWSLPMIYMYLLVPMAIGLEDKGIHKAISLPLLILAAIPLFFYCIAIPFIFLINADLSLLVTIFFASPLFIYVNFLVTGKSMYPTEAKHFSHFFQRD